ncbi:hypothetical protein WA158_004252 [Blastocystis sp. Blastoise]
MVGQLWLNALKPAPRSQPLRTPEIVETIKYVDRIIEKPVIREIIKEAEPIKCPKVIEPEPIKCPTLEELQATQPDLTATTNTLEFLNTINFSEANWKETAQKRIDYIWKDRKVVMPSKYEYPEPDPEKSSVKVYQDPNGFTIALFTNVCFQVKKSEFFLYVSTQDAFKEMTTRIGPTFLSGFQFRAKLIPYPNKNVIDEEGSWMIISHSQRNIAHLAEAMNYVLHTAHFPNEYPPIKKLFVPRLKLGTVFPWISMYLEVLRSIYPSEYQYDQLSFAEVQKVAKSGLICFSKLGASSRISHVSYGGIFTSSSQVDTLRAYTYKHFDIDPSGISLFLPIVSVLERAAVGGNLPGRHISNEPELKKFFYAKRYHYRYNSLILEKLSPKEQVEAVMRTDILVGSLGSGFVNAIFMLPGSVVIVASPPFIGGFFFHSIAEYSNIWYLPMYNYTYTVPPACEGKLGTFGEVLDEKCGQLLYQDNVYIVPGVLENYLKISAVHLKIHKYPNYVPPKK